MYIGILILTDYFMKIYVTLRGIIKTVYEKNFHQARIEFVSYDTIYLK